MGSVQAITFTSESTRETVTVFIMDDEEYEGTEDFYATLTTTETAVTIFEEEAKITIIDDGMSYNTQLSCSNINFSQLFFRCEGLF